MGQMLKLPMFDEPQDAPAPDPAWAQGHAAGRAEAEADSTARLAEETARAVELLSDLALQRADIERALLTALAPLFDAITGALLPDIAGRALGPVLTEMLFDAAQRDIAAPPILRAAPETAAALSVLSLPEHLLGGIQSDPTLTDGTIVLDLGGQETCLDLDGARAAIAEALATFTTAPERTPAHG